MLSSGHPYVYGEICNLYLRLQIILIVVCLLHCVHLVLGLKIFNEGVYLFIFLKALNLFTSIVKLCSNAFLGSTSTNNKGKVSCSRKQRAP